MPDANFSRCPPTVKNEGASFCEEGIGEGMVWRLVWKLKPGYSVGLKGLGAPEDEGFVASFQGSNIFSPVTSYELVKCLTKQTSSLKVYTREAYFTRKASAV